MNTRIRSSATLAIVVVLVAAIVGPSAAAPESKMTVKNPAPAPTQYVEIVTPDVDASVELYEKMYGLTFGRPDADLGQARVGTRADGALIGIRAPMAAHEAPIVRVYTVVEDIERAVKEAEGKGATVAYPPTKQGKRGTFAIVISGGIQHGLWKP